MDIQALEGIEAAAHKLKALKEKEAKLIEERAELIEAAIKAKVKQKDAAAAASISPQALHQILTKRKKAKGE